LATRPDVAHKQGLAPAAMAHHDVGREAFVLQFTQNLGNGGATRDAIGIVPGQWDVRADVPRVEVVGSDWYDLRPVVAGRHQGKEFMPRLLLQRRCDQEKLTGKILMQEQYPHYFSSAVPKLPGGLVSAAPETSERPRRTLTIADNLGDCTTGTAEDHTQHTLH
jgi:hypothetical protein